MRVAALRAEVAAVHARLAHAVDAHHAPLARCRSRSGSRRRSSRRCCASAARVRARRCGRGRRSLPTGTRPRKRRRRRTRSSAKRARAEREVRLAAVADHVQTNAPCTSAQTWTQRRHSTQRSTSTWSRGCERSGTERSPRAGHARARASARSTLAARRVCAQRGGALLDQQPEQLAPQRVQARRSRGDRMPPESGVWQAASGSRSPGDLHQAEAAAAFRRRARRARQSAGIWMPSRRAAASTLSPGAGATLRPSIQRLVMPRTPCSARAISACTGAGRVAPERAEARDAHHVEQRRGSRARCRGDRRARAASARAEPARQGRQRPHDSAATKPSRCLASAARSVPRGTRHEPAVAEADAALRERRPAQRDVARPGREEAPHRSPDQHAGQLALVARGGAPVLDHVAQRPRRTGPRRSRSWRSPRSGTAPWSRSSAVVPIAAKASPPRSTIQGTFTSVSTLFTTVGWPNRPRSVGIGRARAHLAAPLPRAPRSAPSLRRTRSCRSPRPRERGSSGRSPREPRAEDARALRLRDGGLHALRSRAGTRSG